MTHPLRTRNRPSVAALAALLLLLAPLMVLSRPSAAAPPPLQVPPAAPALPPTVPTPPTTVPPAAAAGDTLPTIPLDEVKIGQRGYGLSVFAGGKPERFDVEVIGVMRNLSPDMSYIVGRLSGKGLESSGVVAGMSGSPVFLEGRLAGAVSFGWPFSKEAICGITPIASMRRLTTLGGPLPVTPPAPVELSDLLAGRVPADLLERQFARLKPRFGGAVEGAVAGIEWSTSGFGELSRGVLRQALGSVAPAGRAEPSGKGPKPDLAPGSAVAAVLVNGDFHLAATGTVTDHLNDRILALGHQFLGLGPIHVPMASAEVVTVLASQYQSFKISNIGEVVGAFEQDRQAGIEGRLGASAPMIPMLLRVGGLAGVKPRQFQVELADVPELLPLLAGSSLLASLESASYAAGAQSIDLTARFRLARYGDLTIQQSFDGDNAGTAAASHLLAVAGYLVQNPLESVGIRGIEVELAQSPQPRAASLIAVHPDRTVVRPGERLSLYLDLLAYRGERFRHSLDLVLPRDLPAGRYSLLIGDGASADAARLALAPAEPMSFPQALALLRSFHSRRDVAVLGFYSSPGLSVAGEVMPQLPGSVRSTWGAAEPGTAVPLRSTIAQELHETLAVPVDGLLRVDLEVKRRDHTEAVREEPPPGKALALPARQGAPPAGSGASKAPATPATPAIIGEDPAADGAEGAP
ncbi:MAG TPA: SpoIVB peptidase S55 domain-containing protein [Thermoanaerobaculia bacterium]|nr:SpoIVB peptidase S55 domain-containing protein [Thermoanaerobaculia bacterium]